MSLLILHVCTAVSYCSIDDENNENRDDNDQQVRKGDDGRRSSASTSTFFSSDESAVGGRSGADPQALRAFEKLGGFTAMCRQLEPHATCQAMCDALMGMIFGVWGSKHEPRPIREKDVLAIKGNKESWLRYAYCRTMAALLYCCSAVAYAPHCRPVDKVLLSHCTTALICVFRCTDSILLKVTL